MLLASAAAALALPAVLGAAFRGGPVLRVLKIETLDARGKLASELRCAWRNMVVWSPILLPTGFLGALFLRPFFSVSQESEEEFAAIIQQLARSKFALLGICGFEVVAALFILGVIYALIRPQQGVQDILAGTRLAPA
jgi:hypothetical protein